MALPTIPDYALPTAADLPTARASFTLQRDRSALLIHGMQRYFCAAYGADALARPDSLLSQVAGHIAALADAARAAGIPVFYTAQKGNQFLPDRGLQANLWGKGMSAIADHETIIDSLAPQEGDIQLVKHRYSAFQRSNLERLMHARGRDQLIVTGLYAHIGCLATASEAFQLDIEPFFVGDALADFSQDKHRMALDWVAACVGVPMLTGDVLTTMDPAS